MNITKEKTTGLTEELKIEILQEDYAAKIEEALKNQRRKASVPGFRPGNVPMGMIRKMFYKSLLADEVNRIIGEALYGYLQENNVDIILEPLPVDEKSKVDFENEENFVFTFEYALKPKFEIDFKALSPVNHFKIIASEKEIVEYIDQLRKRHGEYSNPEEIDFEDDYITLKYGEGKTGFFHSYDLNDKGKKLFKDKKLHDTFTVSLKEVLKDEHILSHFLNVEESAIDPENEYTYEVTIDMIGRMKPAELNEEFFKKAFPDGKIKSEKELRSLAANEIESRWAEETSRFFMNEAVPAIIEGITFELPDDFIKRYLLAVHEGLTTEELEKDFDQVKQSFRWQLIENKIATDFQISVNEEDIKNHIRHFFITNYFAQFNPDDIQDHLNQLVSDAMKKQEDVKKIYDMLFDKKMEAVLKANMNLEEKSGEFNDFIASLKKEKDKEGKEVKAKAKKTTKKKETEVKTEATNEPELPFDEKPEEPKKEKKTAPKAAAKKTTPKAAAKKTTKKEE